MMLILGVVSVYSLHSFLLFVLGFVVVVALDTLLQIAVQPAKLLKHCFLLKSEGVRAREKYLFQIKAVIAALRNVRGLPGQHETGSIRPKSTEYDIFDWLQSTFGFQVRT